MLVGGQEDFPIRKVLFSAKAEHDSIKNYKIIQQFFTKKGVSAEMVLFHIAPSTCCQYCQQYMELLSAFSAIHVVVVSIVSNTCSCYQRCQQSM